MRIYFVKTIAIITAGGSGKRFPGECKKQFRRIKNKPVLAHAIDCFYNIPEVDNIIVTVPYEDLEEAIALIHPLYPKADITIMEGGKTRQQSVLKALRTIPSDTDFVMIHDGVRLLLAQEEIVDMLNLCRKKSAVIPVHKVKNTIKKIEDKKIVRTICRNNLVEVYTPQIFRYEMAVNYHLKSEKDGLNFTDDAAILEHYGIPVYVYETEQANIKITDKYDYEIVKLLIESK